MTRFDRLAYTICFCAAMLFLGLSTSFLAPLITRVTGNLGVTLSVFSGILILKSLAFSAGSFLLGQAQQRISANKLIALGLLLLPVVSFVYPRTGSPLVFAVSLLIWGCAGAMVEGGVDIRNGDFPEEFAGQLNYLQYGAMSLGAISGPVLLRNAMRTDADFVRLPCYALLPCILFAFWICKLPEPEGSHERKQTGKSALSRIVILSAALMFFACGIDSALNSWSPTAVFQGGIADEANAALMTTAFAIGSLLSRLISAVLVRKLSPDILFTFSVSAVFAAAAAMLIADNFYVMLGLEFLFGFGNGSIFSSLLLLLRNRGCADGHSIGFIIGTKNLGEMVISWLAGIALDHAGSTACFAVFSVGAAILFGLHFAVKRPEKKRNDASLL